MKAGERAILHVDGDSFFASCEVAVNHKLRGKPVVTGQERGIATAMSKEAKKLGVFRGMPVFKIRELYPQVVICHSDYTTYAIFAQRMYNIVRRYTDKVEEYSIDECFADLTDLENPEEVVKSIKHDLQSELGMTFSIGLAPTKVLAKIASSTRKPDGLTILFSEDERTNSESVGARRILTGKDRRIGMFIESFLKDVEIGEVWGIGPASSRYLKSLGVETALDLATRTGDWAVTNLDKHHLEIYYELQGTSVLEVHYGREEENKSIQATRTFTPASMDPKFIFSELSKNIENATVKARRQGLTASRIYFFLKTQELRYHRCEVPMDTPTSNPSVILKHVSRAFKDTFRHKTPYRASGVTLAGLVPDQHVQSDLFGNVLKDASWDSVYKVVDSLDKRYGSHSVVLGSSLKAFKHRHEGGFYRRLRIPYIGEVN